LARPAWLLAIADNVLLIPGTSSHGHPAENLAAQSLLLQDDEITRLTAEFNQP
jgi:pyridoxine 4-dehydrogenase